MKTPSELLMLATTAWKCGSGSPLSVGMRSLPCKLSKGKRICVARGAKRRPQGGQSLTGLCRKPGSQGTAHVSVGKERLNGDKCQWPSGSQLLSWLHHFRLLFNMEDLLLAWSLGCQHDVLTKTSRAQLAF